MFQPALFREDRVEVMHALMQAHPFATLITSRAGQLSADHLPLSIHPECSKKGTIRGHLALANPLVRVRDAIDEALIVFQGPQAYVTPSWYPTKKEHGKAVPTWNYAVVHAYGPLIFHDDSDWLIAHLHSLTTHHESHRDAPWAISDAPRDYMTQQMRGIVGIEMTISRLEGKWKVSQNKRGRDSDGVEAGLLAEPSPQATAVSELVKNARK
ncbi:MAG: FMN-binding negative transcriptional regulator [Pseudomonadota bacterium]